MRENSSERKDIQDKKPYEAIVVMPYSSRKHLGGRESKIDPEFGLTYESKMATLAAAQAYKEGKADKVILVGEDTVGADGKHSTVDFMKELLVAKGVPEMAIVSHSGLNNSVEQLGKISETQKPEDKFLIVSLDFHTPRVKIISKNQKIQAEHGSAEELLERRSEHYKKPIETWKESDGIKKAEKIEVVLQALNRVDTKGVFQKWLTEKLGTRNPLTDFPRQRKKEKK